MILGTEGAAMAGLPKFTTASGQMGSGRRVLRPLWSGRTPGASNGSVQRS
jgi:hypothetical protein